MVYWVILRYSALWLRIVGMGSGGSTNICSGCVLYHAVQIQVRCVSGRASTANGAAPVLQPSFESKVTRYDAISDVVFHSIFVCQPHGTANAARFMFTTGCLMTLYDEL